LTVSVILTLHVELIFYLDEPRQKRNHNEVDDSEDDEEEMDRVSAKLNTLVNHQNVIHETLSMFDIILHVISVGNLKPSDMFSLGKTCKAISTVIFGERMKRTMFEHFPERFGFLNNEQQVPFIKSLIEAQISRDFRLMEHDFYPKDMRSFSGFKLVLFGIFDGNTPQKTPIDDIDVIIFTIPTMATCSSRYLGKDAYEAYKEHILQSLDIQLSRHFSVYFNYNTLSYPPTKIEECHVNGSFMTTSNVTAREHRTLESHIKVALRYYQCLGTELEQKQFSTANYKNITNGITYSETDSSAVTIDENDTVVYTKMIDKTETQPIFMEFDDQNRFDYVQNQPVSYGMKICKKGAKIIDKTYVHHPYFRGLDKK